jgi:catechol 2,3-dioxygenase-like lactoylglutathione lyase family enzyme
MLTGIDHIIIGVRNLEQATSQFWLKLGLVASGGGVHPEGGTENRIIVIGDTYLELIAVRVPNEAQWSMLERLENGEGYLNCVLGSDDLAADAEAMRQRGVSILGPRQGELRAADGKVRGWSRVDVERPDLAQRYPFLIQHDSTGEERRFRLAGWATPPEHPLGAVKVLCVTIAVADLKEAAPRFQHIYGLQPSESFTGEADGWDALLVSFALGESGQHLELAEPLPLSTEEDLEVDMEHLPEAGAQAHYLERFGESVCRVTLAVQSLERARQYLDEHGVTYTYEERPEGRRAALWIHPDYTCGASIVLHEVDEYSTAL